MLIRFWGVRGSTPTPQAENLRYGGNTSCVEVRLNGSIYVFDCGTGIRVLGLDMLRRPGPHRIHLLVGHTHWDHIQGIPFFRPLYDSPNSQFFFHSSSRTPSLEKVMAEQMASPYFPVNLDHMQARRDFCNIDNGYLDMEDGIRIKTEWLNHPQGCLGHSQWREAVNVVLESGAKALILYHHDPDHSDEIVDQVVMDARNYYPNLRAAAEGLALRLGEEKAIAQSQARK